MNCPVTGLNFQEKTFEVAGPFMLSDFKLPAQLQYLSGECEKVVASGDPSGSSVELWYSLVYMHFLWSKAIQGEQRRYAD